MRVAKNCEIRRSRHLGPKFSFFGGVVRFRRIVIVLFGRHRTIHTVKAIYFCVFVPYQARFFPAFPTLLGTAPPSLRFPRSTPSLSWLLRSFSCIP